MRRRLRLGAVLLRNLLLAPLALAWPRSPRRWVFGHAGDLFAGNPKYLFLWLRLHRSDIDARWITGSSATWRTLSHAGLPVERRWSMRGMAAALGARVHAFSHDPADVNGALGRGALLLNLWHGVGLKSLHTGARPGSRLRAWLRRFLYLPSDLVVSTSPAMQAHFAQAFGIAPAHAPQLGYPRLDVADGAVRAAAQAIDHAGGFRLHEEDRSETYLYLPTFRDSGRPFLAQALPDLDRLGTILAARGAVLYVKPHPRTPYTLPDHSAIRRWPDAVDFQSYLGELTGLITDYSSVLYDWLAIRDAGAILYPFDRATYLGGERALVDEYDARVAGVRADTFDQLCEVLRSGAALAPLPAADLAAVRAHFWGGSAHPASPAIVAHVEQRLTARAA